MFSLYPLYQRPVLLIVVITLIILWTLLWKGFSLWNAAIYRQKGWFFILLIINTLGILEIVYLIWFKGRRKPREKTSKTVTVELSTSKKKSKK